MSNLPVIVPETLYTSEEVSDYLRLSLRTVQRILLNKSLPSYKIHGQYRIKGLDLLSYLDAVRQDSNTIISAQKKPADLIEMLEVNPVSIGFGLNWLPLVKTPDFLEPLDQLRKEVVKELGFIMPGVQLHDNLDLEPKAYQIKIHGASMFTGNLNSNSPEPTLLDAKDVYQQLHTLIKKYAYEIISREEVAVILEHQRETRPTVIDEIMTESAQAGRLTVGQLTKILRYLLQEQVSIRNLGLILEILADHLTQISQLDLLAEKVRQGLARQINAPLAESDKVISVLCLDPQQEEELKEDFQPALSNISQTKWSQCLLKAIQKENPHGVLICSVALRRKLALILSRRFPNITVLSYQEIAPEYQIRPLKILSL